MPPHERRTGFQPACCFATFRNVRIEMIKMGTPIKPILSWSQQMWQTGPGWCRGRLEPCLPQLYLLGTLFAAMAHFHLCQKGWQATSAVCRIWLGTPIGVILNVPAGHRKHRLPQRGWATRLAQFQMWQPAVWKHDLQHFDLYHPGFQETRNTRKHYYIIVLKWVCVCL